MAKAVKLRDGYYIQVSSANAEKPVKIWRETKAQIKQAIRQYEGLKDVKYLGKVVKSKFIKEEDE